MEIRCPNCGSARIHAKRSGRKVCGITGTAIGTVGGVSAAARSAKIGASVGFALGPSGSAVGGITGALIGGISGAMAGGSAGAALGDMVDESMLDNLECLACRHAFSVEREEE